MLSGKFLHDSTMFFMDKNWSATCGTKVLSFVGFAITMINFFMLSLLLGRDESIAFVSLFDPILPLSVGLFRPAS